MENSRLSSNAISSENCDSSAFLFSEHVDSEAYTVPGTAYGSVHPGSVPPILRRGEIHQENSNDDETYCYGMCNEGSFYDTLRESHSETPLPFAMYAQDAGIQNSPYLSPGAYDYGASSETTPPSLLSQARYSTKSVSSPQIMDKRGILNDTFANRDSTNYVSYPPKLYQRRSAGRIPLDSNIDYVNPYNSLYKEVKPNQTRFSYSYAPQEYMYEPRENLSNPSTGDSPQTEESPTDSNSAVTASRKLNSAETPSYSLRNETEAFSPSLLFPQHKGNPRRFARRFDFLTSEVVQDPQSRDYFHLDSFRQSSAPSLKISEIDEFPRGSRFSCPSSIFPSGRSSLPPERGEAPAKSSMPPGENNPYATPGANLCYDFMNKGICERQRNGGICRFRHLDPDHPDAIADRFKSNLLSAEEVQRYKLRRCDANETNPFAPANAKICFDYLNKRVCSRTMNKMICRYRHLLPSHPDAIADRQKNTKRKNTANE